MQERQRKAVAIAFLMNTLSSLCSLQSLWLNRISVRNILNLMSVE